MGRSMEVTILEPLGLFKLECTQFDTCCILYSTLDILSIEAVQIFFEEITSRGALMRIKCMRIKTINLISSRKISGAQEEFGNGFFTILPCTYCLGIVAK